MHLFDRVFNHNLKASQSTSKVVISIECRDIHRVALEMGNNPLGEVLKQNYAVEIEDWCFYELWASKQNEEITEAMKLD